MYFFVLIFNVGIPAADKTVHDFYSAAATAFILISLALASFTVASCFCLSFIVPSISSRVSLPQRQLLVAAAAGRSMLRVCFRSLFPCVGF